MVYISGLFSLDISTTTDVCCQGEFLKRDGSLVSTTGTNAECHENQEWSAVRPDGRPYRSVVGRWRSSLRRLAAAESLPGSESPSPGGSGDRGPRCLSRSE